MKLWMKCGLAIAVCTASTAAHAKPVFLKCLWDGRKDISMDVQLNEERGAASYAFPHTGRSFTVPAIFTADKVSFETFAINRKDLTFSSKNDTAFDRHVFKSPPYSYGKCTIDETERAF